MKFVLFCLSLAGYGNAAQFVERDLLVQKEEGFRYRDNLSFVIQLPKKKSKTIDFGYIHDTLRDFEKKSTDDISAYPAFSKKNIATFGMSLLFKKGEDVKLITLSPASIGRSAEIDEVFVNTDSVRKIFISGYECPLPNASKLRPYTFALKEATAPVHVLDFLKSDLHKRVGDKGVFDDNIKTYNSVFFKDMGDWTNVGERIRNKLQRVERVGEVPHSHPDRKKESIKRQKEEISSQFEDGWEASLVDAEQSLRVYFQKNIQNLVQESIDNITPTLFGAGSVSSSSKTSGKIDKGQKKENVQAFGLFLHVHSRMDVCAACSASLYGLMRGCNSHFSAPGYRINGNYNYLLNKLYDVLEKNKVRFSGNFRFRITVSSREPYVKCPVVSISRRNWSGIDDISLRAHGMLSEGLEFLNNDLYCAHKAYQTDDQDNQRIRISLLETEGVNFSGQQFNAPSVLRYSSQRDSQNHNFSTMNTGLKEEKNMD